MFWLADRNCLREATSATNVHKSYRYFGAVPCACVWRAVGPAHATTAVLIRLGLARYCPSLTEVIPCTAIFELDLHFCPNYTCTCQFLCLHLYSGCNAIVLTRFCWLSGTNEHTNTCLTTRNHIMVHTTRDISLEPLFEFVGTVTSKTIPVFALTPGKYLQAYLRQEGGGCVIVRSVIHSFILFVCLRDYWNSNKPISLKLDVCITLSCVLNEYVMVCYDGPTNRKNWLIFGDAAGPGYRFRITFPFLPRDAYA